MDNEDTVLFKANVQAQEIATENHKILKRKKLICSFLKWILKFFEINGITARKIYVYLYRQYLL